MYSWFMLLSAIHSGITVSQDDTTSSSECSISDLIPGLTLSMRDETTGNDTLLTPPCEPNEDDDGTCTIVLDNAIIIFDGNLTATMANYTPFAAYCINGSLSRRCIEGVWVDENIIQEGTVILGSFICEL